MKLIFKFDFFSISIFQKTLNVMILINTKFPADIILYIDKLGFRDRHLEK